MLRWRFLQLEGGVLIALIDRLFVLKQYRRRRVARTLVLNALVDVHEAASKAGMPGAPGCVSVIIPQEPRLLPVAELLGGMGFTRRGVHAADPTGYWSAGADGREFVELALPFAQVVPLLTAAQAAREGVRPAPPPPPGPGGA